MSISYSITLEGGKELQAALDRLEKKAGDKIVKPAVRDSQNILLPRARAAARSVVGGDMGKRIAKALRVRLGKRKIKGSFMYQLSLKPDPEFISKSKSKFNMIKKGKDKGKIEPVRYYIPAAILYGHISPSGKFVQPMDFLRGPDLITRQQRIDNFSSKVAAGIENLARTK